MTHLNIMSKLIGISGKKKSGKDTVADIFAITYEDVVKYHFAQQLKVEVSRACGVSIDYINEHKDNFRLILQGWGTNFRRDLYGINYWLEKMDIAIDHLSNHKIIIIPDVRFKNEYDFILKRGGTIIRVERATGLEDTHISETSLDDQVFDVRIDNNGTLAELVNKVKQITL